MSEWIIAPLLAVDPTGLPTYRQDSTGTTDNSSAESEDGLDEQGDRRGGERRADHQGEQDDDFARGEDRRGELR
ncbi:hypothetical protein G4G28_05925 [Massilia sp. Dwa41.01b]|uniref:hypothetical protein n=1 Tax=unclassified Massilia TaxID=2609279 RepID=UPI0015FF546F|nr:MULTISPECIES: hypothetical protein [unclassified Massilia]QNA88146.1 hypothetical protein G4G28_05925 [Massilia sp. Dwa41.01b]QNA99052.1 hypothetical protein G4G31_09650 [Massilia sp. Se16.2.3]